jgi:hypothetical protein
MRRAHGERYHVAATWPTCITTGLTDRPDRPAAEAAWLEALAILDELRRPEADELRAKLADAAHR